MRPEPQAIERLVRMALEEDAPWGDITSDTLLPPAARITAQLIAREPGVLCGEDVFAAAMSLTDPALRAHFAVHDGDRFERGTLLATVEGPARTMLRAERVALNFVQHLSGIATLTAQYVAAVAGTKARITDTRKTTPGLRLLERYAVRCGGGHNHRFSLSDAAMVKDNHLAVLARSGAPDLTAAPETKAAPDLTAALLAMRAALPHTAHLEVEVDRLDQIASVLRAGVNTILLDNFTTDDLRAGVAQVASLTDGRTLVEASGGITLARIAEVAATGVDLISVGALTQSVRCLDIGLDLLP